MKAEEFEQRLSWAETTIARLNLEVAVLRRMLRERQDAEGMATDAWARVEPEPEPRPKPIPAPDSPVAKPALTPPPRQLPEPAPARTWTRELSFADLFGAKALAWAGGIVTLLGVVFFFVLAVNQGWIGPGARVALGGLTSGLVFGAGLWLRHRFGETYSSLAAVGAGIAGAYATLLAATGLYGMVSEPAALVVATSIAGLGAMVSLAWRSQLTAGIGLVGAMVVPAFLVLDGGLTTIGTAFVVIVLACAALVAVRLDWNALLVVAALVALPQAGGLVLGADGLEWGVAAVAAACWLVLLSAGIALQLRTANGELVALAASLVTGGAAFAGLATGALFDGDVTGISRQGIVLAVVALVHASCAAVFLARKRRELSGLLGAVALAVGAVAVGDLASGQTLAIVWAAEAALLAWLARRVGEVRYQVASLVYLGLGVVHLFEIDAPVSTLFTPGRHPAAGTASVIAVSLALAVSAVYAREWKGGAGGWVLAPVFDAARANQAALRIGAAFGAALLGVYALSLGVLELFEALIVDVGLAFDWGHMAISAIAAMAGLAALLIALRSGFASMRQGALVWLGLVLVKVLAYDAGSLGREPRSYAFLAVAASVLSAAVVDQLSRRAEPLQQTAVGLVAASTLLSTAGALTLLEGTLARVDVDGAGLVALGAIYGGISVVAFRRHRDLSTLLWAVGLALAGVGAALILDHFFLVLAWTATAGALGLLAARSGESRLLAAGAAFSVAGLALTVAGEAPPSDLFVSSPDPGAGVPSVLLVATAIAIVTYCAFREWPLETLGGRLSSGARLGAWVAGATVLYGLSLLALELAEVASHAGQTVAFQRGHTAVSALWGVVGLTLLYAGLRRRLPALRVAGLALFGVALAKLFVYDLAFLSSITRALSFLAVGAVLLVAAFFYQRLSAESEVAYTSR